MSRYFFGKPSNGIKGVQPGDTVYLIERRRKWGYKWSRCRETKITYVKGGCVGIELNSKSFYYPGGCYRYDDSDCFLSTTPVKPRVIDTKSKLHPWEIE